MRLHPGPTLLLVALATSACQPEGRATPAAEVAVRVAGLAIDEMGAPVVLLGEIDGQRSLPIWIGPHEARSIAAELAEAPALRPNTHDLAERLIRGLEGDIERVVVTSLDEHVFYASIDLVSPAGASIEIDARPSDAIALALRMGAPIFVRASVFETAGGAADATNPEPNAPVDPERSGEPKERSPGTDRQVPSHAL